MSTSEYEAAVEALVDKGGIRGMLEALASVCTGKAEHVQVNWQDKGQAAAWGTMSGVMVKAHAKAEKLGL